MEIIERLASRPGDRVIDKPRYSAFHRTDLDRHLRELGARRLIVAGVLTDACVLATVLDAFALGYGVDLIADACTSTTEAAHNAAARLLEATTGRPAADYAAPGGSESAPKDGR